VLFLVHVNQCLGHQGPFRLTKYISLR